MRRTCYSAQGLRGIFETWEGRKANRLEKVSSEKLNVTLHKEKFTMSKVTYRINQASVSEWALKGSSKGALAAFNVNGSEDKTVAVYFALGLASFAGVEIRKVKHPDTGRTTIPIEWLEIVAEKFLNATEVKAPDVKAPDVKAPAVKAK
jgi:hypothetical protein